jgi:aquaporin Z
MKGIGGTGANHMNHPNARVLAAEFGGTFMLVIFILGAAFHAFNAPAGATGILGVALSVGFGVTALAYAIGHVSGGHFNPAVTLGLIAGGRFPTSNAVAYIFAQCAGAVAACALLAAIGGTPATFGANGFGELSATKASLVSVFLIEALLTGFLVFAVMGSSSRRAPAGFTPIVVGATLAMAHIIAIPLSNTSVNPARSLGSAVFGGGLALSQLWLFWVAPIVGGVAGGLFARWLQDE